MSCSHAAMSTFEKAESLRLLLELEREQDPPRISSGDVIGNAKLVSQRLMRRETWNGLNCS